MNEQEIIKLKNKGMKIVDIAKKFKVHYSTIHYYLNRDKRLKQIKSYFKKLPLEKKREIYKRKIPYIRDWKRNKYHNDPVFRKKQLDRTKKWRKRW